GRRQPAAGPRGPPAPSDRGPVRHGALRRHRRPLPQEGRAGGLRPRQPWAAAARLQPHRVRPARLGRPGLRPDRARLGQAARAHRVPGGGLEPAVRGPALRAGRLRRRRRLRHPAPHHRGARPGPGDRRELRFLPRHPAVVLRRGRGPAPGAQARPATGRRLAPGRRGEAVRPRPGVGSGAERHPRRRLPARVGVPHRPLPGQGDGAEHPGDALRQQHVRAGLERQLRRPRADHHGRGHRHRRSRRLLRRHRGRPRRHPEPPPPADGPGRHGGADVLRRRQPAPGEAEGALLHDPAPTTRPQHRARAVRRGLVRRREGAGVPRRGGHQEVLDDRDVRRHHRQHRDPALGRGAVLPAARQAARASGHRGGDHLQARAAPALQRDLHRGAHPERPGRPGAARRGDDPAIRLQGAGHHHGDPRRQHGLRLRRLLHRGQPRGLRATDPRRPAGRPAVVPAARGGRALVEDPRPRPGPLGPEGPARQVSGGHLGPTLRRRDAGTRRPHLEATM
ncbi:MAG: Glucose-6-phosphate 1-dehydrogenase, partial [uncultured Nocardioides sp.]